MKFPLVEAFLVTPTEGQNGKIGICTNTQAPGMIVNEIPFEKRSDVAVLGSLVVNRDGAERMIINSLSHPKLEYIILFGEETVSFRPSTNLLLALMHGYEQDKDGNIIAHGKGIAHHYPSIPKRLLDLFASRVKIIPLYKHHHCDDIVKGYLDWLADKIPSSVHQCLADLHKKKKFYYDNLLELIDVISQEQSHHDSPVELDIKDFQHLQPPILHVTGDETKPVMPFHVRAQGASIHADIDFPGHPATISGNDSWLMAYSIMAYMNKQNLALTTTQQLLLGAELSRAEIQLKNNLAAEPFSTPKISLGERAIIPLQARTVLKADKQYYYKISIKDNHIRVQSMAHDTCENVYELRSKTFTPLIEKIDTENRFQSYEQEALHRFDVGIEVGRAAIALTHGQSYFQDFRNLFTLNTTDFPLFINEADTFLANHQKIITNIYTQGLTAQHPDTHKGTMRAAAVLGVYRDAPTLFSTFLPIYSNGSQTIQDMRAAYKQQLSSPENTGAYTYGNRTRKHFGHDQLNAAAAFLRANPDKPFVIQRFDYLADMTLTETHLGDRTRLEATHDPCLTHDIYFIKDGKLHSFHIARAHNIVNAYPENVYGLYDAYDSAIAEKLSIPFGDLYMLSNRANILLLTEEQKAKKLIAEPAKPIEQHDVSSGPYRIGDTPARGVAFLEEPLLRQETCDHPCLATLTNYQGTNILAKATSYLKKRGAAHNNPIIGTIDPTTHTVDDAHRLAFFQCNAAAGTLHATAVFLKSSPNDTPRDKELCRYLATQYSDALGLPLGKLFVFYVPLT